MADPTITLARGSTLSLAFYPVALPEGDWQATSQLRQTKGELVADLTVTVSAPSQTAPEGYTVLVEAAAGTTAAWPLQRLQADIRFEDADGVVMFSKPFYLTVKAEITDG